jgi:hypothetical protein
MSEWLKEHAWKSAPLARADAHQIPPTHFRINDFRKTNMRGRVLVSDALHQSVTAVSDTVLTQPESHLYAHVQNQFKVCPESRPQANR